MKWYQNYANESVWPNPGQKEGFVSKHWPVGDIRDTCRFAAKNNCQPYPVTGIDKCQPPLGEKCAMGHLAGEGDDSCHLCVAKRKRTA